MVKSKLELIDFLYTNRCYLQRFRYHLRTHPDRTSNDIQLACNVGSHITRLNQIIDDLQDNEAVTFDSRPAVPQ